jgi:hypothetical protein
MAEPYQDPSLPSEPTEEDFVGFSEPTLDITAAQPVTVPGRESAGMTFDFDALFNKVRRDGFQSLDPAQQELLRNMKRGIAYPGESAAKFVEDYSTKLREQSSPKAQADLARAQADLAAAESEAKSKAAETAAARTRITSVLDTINKLEPDLDNLVGPLAPAAQMKDKWVNPETYAKRFDLANTTKNEVLEAAKYVKPLSNDERKFLEDMFPKIDDPAPVWRSYFERSRRMLSAGLGDSTPAPQATPQANPQLPAERISPGGIRLKLNPDGRTYSVAK